jgi:uncharacterized protein YbjT (DUF2867 family)
MKNILITGATGNVGKEVIRFLFEHESGNKIFAGVRNIPKAKSGLAEYPQLNYREFDFEKPELFDNAFTNIDTVFLLRPPPISDVEQIFKPLLQQIGKNGINEILFLSVQGAEKSKIIPHNKIENLIMEFDFEYIFLRPSYFMQNLTTTLLDDIQQKGKIILPAGNAKFNWVDIQNIAEVTAILFDKFDEYKNREIEITGYGNINFARVTELINQEIEDEIEYKNVNPLRFYWIKKKDGLKKGRIMIMLILHFLPRFQEEPKISTFYEDLTGKKPTMLSKFIKREKNKFN